MMHMTKAMFKRSAATVGPITLLWILSTLMIPPSSHAAIFFDTDFQTCTTLASCEGWGGPDQPGAQQLMTNGGFTGSKYLRHSANGPDPSSNPISNGGTGGNTAKPSIYYPRLAREHVFLRFAIRVSPGMQVCRSGTTKLMRIRPEVNGGYPVLWVSLQGSGYILAEEAGWDNSVGGGGRTLFSNIRPSFGQWDQVEVEYKWNTPGQTNGILRMWVNGTLRIESLNRAFRGPTPTSKCAFGAGNNTCSSLAKTDFAQIYNQCLVGTIDYDRVAIGDTRIGLTNPKQTSTDSIAPASPQGFQVR